MSESPSKIWAPKYWRSWLKAYAPWRRTQARRDAGDPYKHTLLVDIPPNRLTIFPGPEGFKSFETRPGQKLVTGSSDRVFLWEVGRVKVFFSADEVPSRVLTHYVEYRTSLTMR